MSNINNASLNELVDAVDVGARRLEGAEKKLLVFLAVSWAIFQLWIASPLPFILNIGIFSSIESRYIHFTFALFLVFIAFPATVKSNKFRVSGLDWLLALVASSTGAYLYVFYDQLAQRPGSPILQDVIVGGIGLLLVLEATRRSLGLPLASIALIFILYSVLGPYMPSMIAHKGVSFNSLVNHQWLTTQGVFGIALGVSTSFVFLFVLFGALLEKGGAGNFFIKTAFSVLGKYSGGPAKAAVVASGLTGLVSGSSIANVVTTGTFTIPMMRKVGFSAEKAGAVEVASSVNGQIMPPVMGAAAFLMVEYIGIPYSEVIKSAFLPALISYISLIFIVHLEAQKMGAVGIKDNSKSVRLLIKASKFLFGFLVMSALSYLIYFCVSWVKDLFHDNALYIILLSISISYIYIIKVVSRYPDLEEDDSDLNVLPNFKQTLMSGLHYLLPVVILIWCLMVEQMSPSLSSFWASSAMIFILLTQKPLKAAFRKEKTESILRNARSGTKDLLEALEAGSRNMIGIAVATAAAGIVVGAVAQTGIGLVLADLVEYFSMGNILIMLILTALLCLILGMGLPTTANYIVVSALLAPVIVSLGEQNGLIVPLIAVHLFVFYFGIMADVTPPVGLASFAAAAVAKGDPIKTGLQAFKYSLRTALLPFIFIYNTDLLLIDVTWYWGIIIFCVSTIAMMAFSSGMQSYLIVKNKWYENLAFLLIAFTLLRPGFWLDLAYPPFQSVPLQNIESTYDSMDDDHYLKIQIDGFDKVGEKTTFFTLLPKEIDKAGKVEHFEDLGLNLIPKDDGLLIDTVSFASPAEKLGFEFDQKIISVSINSDRPSKELFWIPAFLMCIFIYYNQLRRKRSGNSK